MFNPYESPAGDAEKRSEWQSSDEEAIRIPADLAWPSFSFATGYCFIVLFGLVASIIVVLNGDFNILALLAWYSFLALFLVVLVRSHVSLTRDPSRLDLIIDSEGVHEGTLWMTRHLRWEEIESVSTTLLEGPPKNVAFRFHHPRFLARRSFGGYHDYLQQRYKVPPEKICEIIARRLQRFQAEQGIALEPVELDGE